MQKASLQRAQETPLKLTFSPTGAGHIGFISKYQFQRSNHVKKDEGFLNNPDCIAAPITEGIKIPAKP